MKSYPNRGSVRSKARCSFRASRGYTLIEILTVCAILFVCYSILTPVVAQAQRSGHKAATIINLRSCTMAMVLYSQNEDDQNPLPSREVAMSLLGDQLTWDAEDSWRSSRTEDWGAPMVGSFGYVGALSFYGNGIMRKAVNPPIFADVFYDDKKLTPFTGYQPPIQKGAYNLDIVSQLPCRVLIARLDGSVKFENPCAHLTPGISMDWRSLFMVTAYPQPDFK